MIRHDPFARPPWEPSDSAELRRFLLTRTGQRLVFRLQNDRPRLGGSKELQSSLEANALWAKEIRGYETAVRNLFEYLNTPVDEKATADTYQSLDLDSVWSEELQVPEPLQPPPVPAKPQPPAAILPEELPQPEIE